MPIYSRTIKILKVLDSKLLVAFRSCVSRSYCSVREDVVSSVNREVIVSSYLNSPNYV